MAEAGSGARVMLVEDDRVVRDVVTDYLQAHGYDVVSYADGTTAREVLRAGLPDLLILDRMLPGVSGDQLLQQVRARSGMPIIMLTALDSAGARIDGLERGADDYIAKPFTLRELHLRIASLLRRAAEAQPLAAFTVGPFRIDPAQSRISLNGADLALTSREYELLVHFLQRPGEVISRTDLLHEVWGWSFGDASTVTVHVRRLREKIERDPGAPELLETVWGAGYRLRLGSR